MSPLRMKRRKFWIQDAIKKTGALSRQLGVPVARNIPTTLLQRIRSSPIGAVVRNPTKTGKRSIKVTRLLKKRAVLALTLKELAKKKKRGR